MSDDWTSDKAGYGDAKVPAAGSAASGKDANWERDLLNRLAFASLKEQRRARRWGILFKTLTFVYLFGLLFLYRPSGWDTPHVAGAKYTALVEVSGIIAADADASADQIIVSLRKAFEDKKTAGVIMRINSPGGSPVQAGYINDEMRRLRAAHPDIPLYAVVTDVCASGGYYIAVGADQIYADKASIVGSIGVRMDSFGFVDAMQKLGIERRLLTAGDHKGFLDPFLPENPDDVTHVQTLLNDIHEQFIRTVKTGRGERLKPNDKLFSGLVWTGEQGVELGLVDGIGSAGYVARELIGAEEIVDFTSRPDFLQRFARGIGAAMGQSVMAQLVHSPIKL
ncbi:MAG: S49 family peptidase [Gammaproteobacteria bacterium]|nr:S49 family peptidase [Gammaproteobacteria bacterium]